MSRGHDIDIDDILERSSGQRGHLIEYQPGNSFVHRLNPITKLLISVCLVLIAFLYPSFEGPLALSIGVAVIIVAVGITRAVAKVVAIIWTPVALSLLIIHGLVHPDNVTVLFTIEPVPFFDQVSYYREGFEFALLFMFRILVFLIALLTSILTTHPKRLTTALRDKGMSNKFAYVFLATLQLIPFLQERARAILEAQKARGLDTQANLRVRIRSVLAILIPLLIGTLIATETRALALESRGFSRTGERTVLLEVPDTIVDRGLRWLAVIAVLGVAVWRVVLA